jgi:glycerate dehydrogenase
MKITILDKYAMGEDLSMNTLERFGEVVIYNATSNDEITDHIADSDVIVLNKVKITDQHMAAAKNLKLICIFATGYDNIDIQAAKRREIAVCNVPGYSTNSVVLFTLSNVLALYSKLFEYNQFVKSGEYSESGVPNKLTPVFHELHGKVWGIVGLGNIGKAVAKVAEAMGAHVIANKRTYDDAYECVEIDELCRRSDIITLHCPLNDGTKNLINKDRIDLMKREVVIVNEARGAVVNEEDIRDAILSGRIAGYGSDVYSQEPFPTSHPFDSIKNKSNVLLTPHAAWGAYEARVRCLDIICQNIEAFIEGKMSNRVDKSKQN